ncbi:MAG: peptidoglycan DD-metalloendopeptidase family protein [Candidatus Sericytochromatia bacterium]
MLSYLKATPITPSARVAPPAPVAASAPAIAAAPTAMVVSPEDVSYEPMLAGALRRTWAFLSGLFKRGNELETDPIGGAGGTVTVQRGDSLSKIAQRTLGSSGRWREIYDANRDKLGNPNIVWPGLTLRVPGGSSSPAPHAPHAPSAPSGKLSLPVHGRFSSPYGMRKHPVTGQHKLHTGLDIAAATGTPVKVPRSGTVTFAGWSGGYGNYVVIDHGNGLQTAYAHLSAINVRKGQSVSAGSQLGKVGSTGMSTGPHLHFEVKRNGQFVDPKTVLG